MQIKCGRLSRIIFHGILIKSTITFFSSLHFSQFINYSKFCLTETFAITRLDLFHETQFEFWHFAWKTLQLRGRRIAYTTTHTVIRVNARAHIFKSIAYYFETPYIFVRHFRNLKPGIEKWNPIYFGCQYAPE